MTKFKVGDRVRCVDDSGRRGYGLLEDNIYEVLEVKTFGSIDQPALVLAGVLHEHKVFRFELVEPQHVNKFQPGDQVKYVWDGRAEAFGEVVETTYHEEHAAWYVTVNWTQVRINSGYLDSSGWSEDQLTKIGTTDHEAKINMAVETAVEKALDSLRTTMLDSIRTELNATLNLNLGE